MRVAVNAEYCEHSGECVGLVPRVFSFDADGNTVTIDRDVPAEFEDDVHAAADFCPRLAVSVMND